MRISIFDLDGTLSIGDTYLPYLLGYLIRRPDRWLRAAVLPFAVLLFGLRMRNNQWLKEVFLTQIFSGVDAESIASWNQIFLDRLLRTGLRTDVIEILRIRQEAGDVVILSTASLELYVEDLASRLGIQHIICTRIEWDGAKPTGKLDGMNCYGSEKISRVKNYLEANNIYGEVHAYSDHSSDWPLLEFADKAYAVYPTTKLTRIAILNGINIINDDSN